MKLNVTIEYRTSWGEELVLCLGGKRYPLAYTSEGIWEGEVARLNIEKAAEYCYEVVRDGQTVRTEWKKHTLVLPEGMEPKVLTVYDRWNDRPADSPFYSSAFTNAIFGRPAPKAAKAVKGANVIIKVAAPTVRPAVGNGIPATPFYTAVPAIHRQYHSNLQIGQHRCQGPKESEAYCAARQFLP